MPNVKLMAKEALKKVLDGSYVFTEHDRGCSDMATNSSYVSTINDNFWKLKYAGSLYGILRLSLARLYNKKVDDLHTDIQLTYQVGAFFASHLDRVISNNDGQKIPEFQGLDYSSRSKLALERMISYGEKFNERSEN